MRTTRYSLLIAGLTFGLCACVSTTIMEKWKDPAFAGPPLHKVLVVSVQRDQGRRRLWEDAMVSALAKRGVQAEASYQVFPDQAPAPDQLLATAKRDTFDGVAATHFVGLQQHVAAYGPGWGWGWRSWAWGPGPYVEEDTRADYQTDIYTIDGAGGKLLWTGVTRSLDPSSTKSVTNGISQALVPQLVKEGILTGNRS
jgi:hypothetical protein